jgi:hypothetical protein
MPEDPIQQVNEHLKGQMTTKLLLKHRLRGLIVRHLNIRQEAYVEDEIYVRKGSLKVV